MKRRIHRPANRRVKPARAQQQARFAQAGLNALVQAVLVTDRAGRPLLMNDAAARICADLDGLGLLSGRLAAVDPGIDLGLQRAIANASRQTGACGGALLIARPSGRRAFQALINPWPDGRTMRVLILIEDPEAPRPGLPASLMGLYGLTAAEAQTAARLGDGLSPEEIARERSVSLATIRTQIRVALRKTGAHRASELVTLIARLPQCGTLDKMDKNAGQP